MTHRTRIRATAKEDRKLAQLCAQVQETVSLALGDSSDPHLRDLVVHSATPAPDGARLLILVVPSAPLGVEAIEAAYQSLEGARAWLRQEVAAEIHRKRTPELAFQILPRWEDET